MNGLKTLDPRFDVVMKYMQLFFSQNHIVAHVASNIGTGEMNTNFQSDTPVDAVSEM